VNKFVVDRSYAAPKAAARELVEIANATERLQHGQGRGAEGKFNCGPCERGAACLRCGAVRDRTAHGRSVIFQCKL
jgi:hypothetical protein